MHNSKRQNIGQENLIQPNTKQCIQPVGSGEKQIKEAALKKADTSGSIVIIKPYAGIVCSTTTTKKQN